jgi:hypothetical protein
MIENNGKNTFQLQKKCFDIIFMIKLHKMYQEEPPRRLRGGSCEALPPRRLRGGSPEVKFTTLQKIKL